MKPEREKPVTRERKQVGKKQIVGDVIAAIPDRVLNKLRNNDQVKPCCRQVETNSIEFFQTHEDIAEGKADLIIMTCDVCGAKHYHAAAAGKKN